MIRSTMTAFAFAASSTIASAALVVNDTFDYGASDILGNSSPTFTDTTGWTSGSNNVRYESAVTATWGGDADYTLLPSGASTGGAMAVSPASTPLARGMQLDFGSALDGTFWLATLMRLDSTTAGVTAVMGFENGSSSNAGVDHGGFGFATSGDIVTTLGVTPTDSGADLPAAANTWHLFVAKMTVNNSGTATDTDDALKLWVFNAGSSIGGQTEAALGAATYSSSTVRFGNSIQDVWFGAYRNGTGTTAYMDNLRVSNLSTDNGLKEVLTGTPVPEPASLATLAMGAIAVLRRRR